MDDSDFARPAISDARVGHKSFSITIRSRQASLSVLSYAEKRHAVSFGASPTS